MERPPLVDATEQVPLPGFRHRSITPSKDRPQFPFQSVVHEDALHERRSARDVVNGPLIVAKSLGTRLPFLVADGALVRLKLRPPPLDSLALIANVHVQRIANAIQCSEAGAENVGEDLRPRQPLVVVEWVRTRKGCGWHRRSGCGACTSS